MKEKKYQDQYEEEKVLGTIWRRKKIWTNIKKKQYLDKYKEEKISRPISKKYLDQYDGSKVIWAQGVQGGALAVPW